MSPEILSCLRDGAVPKRFRAGTHRSAAPAETVERARRICGAAGITRVANITGLDVIGVPVVSVIRPNARSMVVSQGKGADLDAARASGLMEAIEMYHAEHVAAPLRLDSYADLRASHRLADVARLPRIGAAGFDEYRKILWIEGYDLVERAPTWVPYELVHTDFTLPLPTGSGALAMSSNGLASGNHLLEAICHGIHEIVERDATTLWHLSTAQASTRLCLDTVDSPVCQALLERYERADVSVAVWETTSDVGLPSFLCALLDRSVDPLRRLAAATGMGCHPAREIALLRALTEAAQTRLTIIAGAREEAGADFYDEARDPNILENLSHRMRAERPVRRFSDAPMLAGDTFNADIDASLSRLRAVGVEQVIVVDLSRPEIGIPVVRVVIPGLEFIHDAPGYVPGQRARALLAARERPST
ncbi:YcaO-like family protein [Sorangium sp. So ce1000]|uniref:YcaO-like family protein n=1 Tax=Sorangium sp. So ce1000 TaxID=3133325 RepID=UPI003F5FC09F